ncbi:Nitroreductase [Butyrivibrio hungatei]|uniref:Nitroreductase n=1 Tax=Butyrivibrio hungatei TaxID=185008 RepID=A0A1G5F3J6_9FIRM|nr:nitroreductase family protein [Butyrivibrio hungatei]SCY33777.1 Nitroreductase [Butyrivibrio hungatei]
MTEIEAIKARHSVRSYKPQMIEPEKIIQLRAKVSELNAESGLHLQFIEDAGRIYNNLINRARGLGSAPSVIACVGRASDDLEQKIGYYGEKLVLFAQSLGLNTCWTGGFNHKTISAEVAPDEKLVIAIAIGYGKDQGKVRKSKTFEQVVEAAGERPDWFNQGVEMALLAPTAINQQKFVIKFADGEKVEFIDKGGPFSKVDIGIVKCHFEIGSGKKI